MKILIAEDQAIIREMMVKMLTGIGHIESFDTGRKALQAFEQAFKDSDPFELMILDVSMPGMSGIDLLKSVRAFEARYKVIKAAQVKVLMMTSYADKETVIACYLAGCNDYAVKPFNSRVVIEKIRKMGFTVDTNISAKESLNNGKLTERKTMGEMVSDAIEAFKKGMLELPSIPNIVQDLQNLINSPNASVYDMAKIIENDTAISIKLIIAANYPFYGTVEKIKDVKSAINTLGINVTQSIVVEIANKVLYETTHPSIKTLMDKIWIHSFATAHCSREIAKRVSSVGYEKAYVKGLIHDVGATLLIKNIDATVNATTPIDINELMNAVFEVHTSFGAALLKKWNFSQDFVDVANLHEWNQFNEKAPKEVLIVNLADFLSYKIGHGFFNKEDKDFSDMHSATLLGLKESDLTLICKKAEQDVAESAGSFSKL